MPADKLIVLVIHTGLFTDAVGAAGIGYTVTVTTTGLPEQVPAFGVKVYVAVPLLLLVVVRV